MKRNERLADGRWPIADRRSATGSPRRPIPNPQSRFPTPRSASGSVLILVVVMLVLLALIGTAYMQRVRLDRTAARITPASHIDEVVAATLDQLRQVLKDDLIHPATGNFLDPTPVGGVDRRGVEGYDYPWTNPAERRTAHLYHGGTLATLARPLGGHLDDPWLASSYPDDVQFNPPAAATAFGWRHITNLNGIFLSLPAEDPTNPAVRPYEHTTHQAVPGNSHGLLDHTDAALRLFQGTDNFPALDAAPQYIGTLSSHEYQPRGHDVDGDGVLDARWTWAPIRTINGIDYVMAVRIIDNGAMLNVNAATALTTDGQDAFPPGILAPNALWPTALDFSRILQRVNAGYRPEATRNLLLRRGGPSASPTPVTPHYIDVTGGNVATIEPAAASYYFNVLLRYGQWTRDNRFFGPENEIALRFGNGVRSSRFGTPPVEWISDEAASPAAAAPDYTQGIGRMLRNRYGMTSTTEELHYTRVINQTPGTTAAQKAAQVADFFHGVGNPSAPGYRLDDLRKWLTTHNGAAEILPLNFFEHHNDIGTTARDLEARQPLLAFDPTTANASRTTFNARVFHENAASIPPPPFEIDPLFAAYVANVELNTLATRLAQIFFVSDPGSPDAYLERDISSAADRDFLIQLAGNFAASIKDYWDDDDDPTLWTFGANWEFYGLERLPFLRQAYIQTTYEIVDEYDHTVTPSVEGADGVKDGRTFIPGSQAFAVEIGNPFSDTIDMRRLDGRVRLVLREAVGTDWWWKFDTGGAVPFIHVAGDLGPGEYVVIYKNPDATAASAGPGDDLLNGGLDDIEDADDEIAAPNGGAGPTHPAFSLGTDIIIELQIDINGTWITYDRMISTDFHLGSENLSNVAPNDTEFSDLLGNPGDPAYDQISLARQTAIPGTNDHRPYYISTTGQDIVAQSGPSTAWDGNMEIGLVGKSLPAGTEQVELEHVQLMVANRPVLNPVELANISMIGFAREFTGGTWVDRPLPDRVAGMLGMVTPAHHETIAGVDLWIPRVMFLDLSPDAAVPAVNGAAIPHAAMVLDLLSTISPQADGLDNDGDGNIDAAGGPRELFVPGRLNVNTAPLHLLTLAAPLPEAVGDIEDLMRSVINYRDNVDPATGNPWRPTQAHTNNPGNLTMLANYRQEPGVLSLAELLWMNPQDNTGNPADMQGYLGDTAALPTTPGSIDLNPLPTETSASNPRTNSPVIDDAEERVARFQFLNQVFTTRSDVYTAYVEIRGYPAHDYRGGPVERTRFLVVLDRGRIASSDDDVRVIAMYRY